MLAAVALLTTTALVSTACTPEPPTKIGLIIPRQGGGVSTIASESIAQADYLGVGYMRMEQQVDEPVNSVIRSFVAGGKQVNMVVKTGPGTVSQPPTDIAAYKAKLATRLDEYHTPLLAIENEETADNFYAGTPGQYLTELGAAVQVGHAKGVEVTNGGIPFVLTALVTWNDLRKTQGTGKADAYINAAFESTHSRLNELAAGLTGYPANAPDPYTVAALPIPGNLRKSWPDAEYLYSKYGSDAGDVAVDVVNFHWYVTDEVHYTAAKTQALRDTIDFVQRSTGKRAVTNEIGQWGTTPEAAKATVTVLMTERHLPWALWFDHDGLPAHALHDYTAGAFVPERDARPNGKAFKAAVATAQSG